METSSSEARLDLYTDTNYEGGEPVLAGNITVSGTAGQSDGAGGREFNTLDEPISQTIKRDLSAVATKFLAVLWPKEKKSLLREWDLWGPLILCTIMATILQGHTDESGTDLGDGGPQFAEVFVIVWVGAMIVTLNTKLLGRKQSHVGKIVRNILSQAAPSHSSSLCVCWATACSPSSSLSFCAGSSCSPTRTLPWS